MSTEHRWPKKERASWPSCFVLWYSWKRLVFFTPKVRLRALQVVVSTLCGGPYLIGLYVGRDEGGEVVLHLGLGFTEVEVHVMRFYSDAEIARGLLVADLWRHPPEESHLYPGLCLHDGRVSGSITAGCTRLPLWAINHDATHGGWDQVIIGYGPVAITEDQFSDFVYYLLQQRGEFGRLLLVLADAERTETSRRAWWTTKKHRKRVGDQLRRCLEVLDAG